MATTKPKDKYADAVKYRPSLTRNALREAVRQNRLVIPNDVQQRMRKRSRATWSKRDIRRVILTGSMLENPFFFVREYATGRRTRKPTLMRITFRARPGQHPSRVRCFFDGKSVQVS